MKKLALLLAILFVFQINFVKASDKKVIPPEYKLVEVVETNYNVDDVNTISKESRFWNSWEIRNLSEDNYDIYYPDDPVISDYFDGPADFEQDFSATGSATFNFSTGIDLDVVEAKLGFSSSYSETFTRKYRVQASDDEMVNIKVFINYKQWRFDAYYDGEYKGTEFVHKPIGLKFMQYKYRK